MSGQTPRLVMMANQIARFFVPQRRGDPVAEIADHLEKFWDPRMKDDIVRHLEAGGAGLDPVVREAVARLRDARAGAPA